MPLMSNSEMLDSDTLSDVSRGSVIEGALASPLITLFPCPVTSSDTTLGMDRKRLAHSVFCHWIVIHVSSTCFRTVRPSFILARRSSVNAVNMIPSAARLPKFLHSVTKSFCSD